MCVCRGASCDTVIVRNGKLCGIKYELIRMQVVWKSVKLHDKIITVSPSYIPHTHTCTHTHTPSQLVWHNVTAIGCGSYQCPRLSLAGGGREDRVQFVVCYYLTVFIAGQPSFSSGIPCGGCPARYPICDPNRLCGECWVED